MKKTEAQALREVANLISEAREDTELELLASPRSLGWTVSAGSRSLQLGISMAPKQDATADLNAALAEARERE